MEGNTQEHVQISLERYEDFKIREKQLEKSQEDNKQCRYNMTMILKAIGYEHDKSTNLFTKPINIESYPGGPMGAIQLKIKNV